jgi:hypothetical protein
MCSSVKPFFCAILWLMTLVQPTRAATSVSVGVRPRLVPPRSIGSSMRDVNPRMLMSVRE